MPRHLRAQPEPPNTASILKSTLDGTLSAAPRRLDRISPAAALLLPATPPAIDNRRGQPPLYVFNGATMADATTSTATAAPAAAPTLGQEVDAEIVLLKARVASIEAAGKTDWADVVAWVKSNWAHFVTWAALAASSPIGLDVLKRIV
jgi:hypothetical protein